MDSLMAQSKPHFVIDYTPIEIHPEGCSPKVVEFPLLKTFLFGKDGTPILFRSIVDSGADFCVIPADVAQSAGINIQKGKSSGRTRGIGGTEHIYFHNITVGVIFGAEFYEFEAEVAFSRNLDFGFFGRKGFFDLFDEISFRQDAKKFRCKAEGRTFLKTSELRPHPWKS